MLDCVLRKTTLLGCRPEAHKSFEINKKRRPLHGTSVG